MNLRGIEKHQIIYTFASLISAYIVYLGYKIIKTSFFPDPSNWQFIIGFIIYFFMLIISTKFLIFVCYGLIYVMFAPTVPGNTNKSNHPIKERDFYLTSSSIITIFMVNEIFSIYSQVWILLPLIPGIFLITFFLNTKPEFII